MKEHNRLSDKLHTYLKELPKMPDELNVKPFDMSILEIEPDWYRFVGESFAQVGNTPKNKMGQ